MKKTVLLFAAILMIGCSQTPQQEAEKAVSDYLKGKKSLSDYTPTSFGKLDTIQLETAAEYIEAQDSLRYYKQELRKMGNQFKMAAMQKGAKRMKFTIQNLEILYKLRKYSISHTYSYKSNETGELVDANGTFYLSKSFKVVE